MFVLCPPSKVQGREEVWLSVVVQSVALFYVFFSIRFLPDSCPSIVALFPVSAMEQWEGPCFLKILR